MKYDKKGKAKSDKGKPSAWLWLLCAPAALVASACHESKKEVNKKKAKRHKRAVEYWDWLNGGGL